MCAKRGCSADKGRETTFAGGNEEKREREREGRGVSNI